MSLSLSLSLDDNEITTEENTTLTISRSGGQLEPRSIYYEDWESYDLSEVSPGGWEEVGVPTNDAVIIDSLGSKRLGFVKAHGGSAIERQFSNPAGTMYGRFYRGSNSTSGGNPRSRIIVKANGVEVFRTTSQTTELVSFSIPENVLIRIESVWDTDYGSANWIDDLNIISPINTSTYPLTINLTSSNTNVANIENSIIIPENGTSISTTVKSVLGGTSNIQASYEEISSNVESLNVTLAPLSLTLSLENNEITKEESTTLSISRSGGILNESVIYFEPFNYPIGTPISSVPGWTGSGAVRTESGGIGLESGADASFTSPGNGLLTYDWFAQTSGEFVYLYINGVLQRTHSNSPGNTYTSADPIGINEGDVIRFRLIDYEDKSVVTNITITTINTSTGLIEVDLSSSDTGVATVPSTITILENETSATTAITTVDSGSTDLQASFSDSSSNVETLSVIDPPLNLSLSLDPTTIETGETSNLTVTRSGGGEGDPYNYTESFHEGSDYVQGLPDGWAIRTGNSPPVGSIFQRLGIMHCNGNGTHVFGRQFDNPKSGVFSWNAKRDSTYDGDHQLYVNGVLAFDQRPGGTYTHSLNVPANADIEFRITTDSDGGSDFYSWSLVVDAVNTSTDALTIDLSSTDTDVATVPSSITILENETTATTAITTVDSGSTDLQASYDTTDSNVETLTVTDPLNLSLSLDPTTVEAGETSTVTVTRSGGEVANTVTNDFSRSAGYNISRVFELDSTTRYQGGDNEDNSLPYRSVYEFDLPSAPISSATFTLTVTGSINGTANANVRRWTNTFPTTAGELAASNGVTTNQGSFVSSNGIKTVDITDIVSDAIAAGDSKLLLVISNWSADRRFQVDQSLSERPIVSYELIIDASTAELIIDLTSTNTGVATVPSTLTILENETSATTAITTVNAGSTDIQASFSDSSSNVETLSVTDPPLSLALSLDDNDITTEETSNLTVTRSGGGVGDTVVYSESWDNDLSGWVPGGYLAAQTTSLTRSGAGCVSMQSDENDGSILTFSRTETSPGVMKFWYYKVNGSVTNYNFGLRINGTTVWNVTSGPSVYTEYSVDIPAGTNTYQFYIAGPGGSRSSNNRIDDLTISSVINTATEELTIDLTSTDTGVATVPSTITILENETSATTAITNVNAGSTDIQASFSDSSSNVETLSVIDPLNLSLSLDPTTIETGETSNVTVTRSGGNQDGIGVLYEDDFESYTENTPALDTGWTFGGGAGSALVVTYSGSKKLHTNPSGNRNLSKTFTVGGILTFEHIRRHNEGVLRIRVNGTVVATIYNSKSDHSYVIPDGATVVLEVLPNEGERFYFDNFKLVGEINTATGPLTINLLSDDTNVATVPNTLTIPSGESSGSTIASGISVGNSLITASYGDINDSGALTVTYPPLLLTLSLDDNEITKEETSNLTITRSGGSPDPLTVNLTSSNTSVATVVSTVTILENETSATIALNIIDVGSENIQSTNIQASFSDIDSNIETLYVDYSPLELSISLSENEISTLGNSNITVTRSGGGSNIPEIIFEEDFNSGFVNSTSSGWGLSSVGSDGSRFAWAAGRSDSNELRTLTFTFQGTTEETTLSFDARFAANLTVGVPLYRNGTFFQSVHTQVSSTWNTINYTIPTGTTELQFRVQGDEDRSPGVDFYIDNVKLSKLNFNTSTDALIVNLTSSNPHSVTVPSTITIPANQTTATTSLNIIDAGESNIQASYENINSNIEILSIYLLLELELSLNEENIQIGDSSSLTITRYGGPDSPLLINLTSSDTDVATVPSSITILRNESSAIIPITVIDAGISNIRGSYGGVNSNTKTLSVSYLPFNLTLSLDNNEITTEESSILTVTRSGGSPDAINVNLTSSDTDVATVPSSITIPSNQTTATISLDIIDIGSTNIQASYDGTDSNIEALSVVVAPLTLSISLSSNDVTTEETSNLIVTRSGGDSTDEITINLTSSDVGIAFLPSTITILANQTSANIPITIINEGEVNFQAIYEGINSNSKKLKISIPKEIKGFECLVNNNKRKIPMLYIREGFLSGSAICKSTRYKF